MKIALLGNAGSWYLRELSCAAERRGHECPTADFRRLTGAILGRDAVIQSDDQTLLSADAVIVRTMPPGSLEQVVYRMDALQRLEAQGVHVLNPPKAVECAVDKFLTSARLAAAEIPTPRTIVCETAEQAMAAFTHLREDVVVKPLFGSEGRGIFRLSDPDLAERAFRTLERLQSVIYLQEFIPHAGFDIRLLVLGGQILGAIKRSHATDFRTNVSRQAQAAMHRPTEQEQQLALRSAQALNACFAGVDLLYDAEGNCHVIEVNAVPGWKAFQHATGIAVADSVIQYLENHHA